MNCVRFEMRLDELLDERSPVDRDADLNGHAETCRHCAQLLADHVALLEAIDVLGRSEARGDLPTRILEQLKPVFPATGSSSAVRVMQRKDATRRAFRRAGAWIGASVAAALLIGVAVSGWRMIQHGPAAADSKVPGLEMRNVAVEEAAVPPPADHRYGLATRPGAEVHSLADLIGPQQRTLMEQMSVGLKPVTHSMSAALHALRRTFPGNETPARPS